MPIKIKSRITASKRNQPSLPDTPLRTGLVRSTSQHSNSGLKNLSEQRDKKKMEKRRE